MSIKQREDELLRSYITHFNKEALSIHQWIVEGEVFVLLIQKRPKDHVRRAILSY